MSSSDKHVRSLYAASKTATNWFCSVSIAKTPSEWKKRGGLDDAGTGSVYVFYGAHDSALYVGQTNRSLKQRALYQKSRHYVAPWWNNWKTVRFLNITNETDRLALELLLILDLLPKHNKKPGARAMNDMLSSLTSRSRSTR